MAYLITDDHVNDAEYGISIIKGIKNRISRLFGDNGYDSKAIYYQLEDKAVIPVRKNASMLSRGPPYSSKIKRFIHRFNEKLWKMRNSYGLRWNVEIYFSEIKRMFGEVIRAVKCANIVHEMILKVYFSIEHNKLRKDINYSTDYNIFKFLSISYFPKTAPKPLYIFT